MDTSFRKMEDPFRKMLKIAFPTQNQHLADRNDFIKWCVARRRATQGLCCARPCNTGSGLRATVQHRLCVASGPVYISNERFGPRWGGGGAAWAQGLGLGPAAPVATTPGPGLRPGPGTGPSSGLRPGSGGDRPGWEHFHGAVQTGKSSLATWTLWLQRAVPESLVTAVLSGPPWTP